MKKIILIALSILPMMVWAQTAEEIRKKNEEVMKLWDCFVEQSKPEPHDATITLSNGKTIECKTQSDYKRMAFVSVDQFLQDVREWKASPYLWQLKHAKNSGAVTDTKNLSKWEVERFDEIADTYFKGNEASFHLASHGLVDASGQATNSILIGGQVLNAEEAAEFIIKSMKKSFGAIINASEKNFVVVLHCCHLADGEDNFASRLSKELAKSIPNISVVGAPQTVYCKFENGEYKEYISSEKEMQKEKPVNYKWKVYKNGVNTGQGTYDYSSTVKTIQK